MGRLIGKRILDACELAQSLGHCTSVDFRKKYQVESTNSAKYLNRAVSHGLMIVDRSQRPHRFTAVEGWQAKAARTKKGPRLSKISPLAMKTHHLAMVWA